MKAHNQDILHKIAQGNSGSFKELYHMYYEAMCRFAWKYVNDEAQAEDIVQDVLIKLWEQRERIVKIDNVKAYLYLSVKNACLNYFEHQKVVAKHVDSVTADINILLLQAENYAFEDEELSLEDLVLQAIDKLPKQSGEIFKMKYLEGKRTKEIAEIADLSPRTVETHVYNALKTLRAMFKHFPLSFILVLIFFSHNYLSNF